MLLALLACSGTESNINQLYPTLVVSPGEVAFGEVVVDYPEMAIVEIINGGRAGLDLDAISLADDYRGVFTLGVIEPSETQDTGAPTQTPLELPLTLASDERLQIAVNFLPTTYLDYETALVFEHNDPEQQGFELSVTGVGWEGPTPDIELDTQTLDFGDVAPGGAAVLWVTITNQGDGPLTIQDSVQTGSGSFVFSQKPEDGSVIAAHSSTTAIVTYLPQSGAGDNGSWTLSSDDPDEPQVVVQLLGNGGGDYQYPVAVIDCPNQVAPPDTQILDGSDSYEPNGLELVQYIWTLERLPEGATATMSDTVGDSTEVFFDIAGDYEITLQVENELGVKSAPAQCEVNAIPADAIHVELLWNTGNADLDLHLAKGEDTPLFDVPGDVSYCNRTPTWGALTSGDDDPRLDLDDRGGYGPENINILAPADDRYPVRVHNFDANSDGSSTATLRFYINGSLKLETSQVLTHNQVWEAGTIKWPEGVVIEEGLAPSAAEKRGCKD